MKKRLVNYLLLVVATFVLCTLSVSAATYKIGDTFSKSANGTAAINGLTVSGTSYSTSKYLFSKDGNSYTAWCLDPHKQAGSNYTIKHLLASAESDEDVRAYEYGILAILKETASGSFSYTFSGGTYESNLVNPGQDFSATLTGDELYAAVSIAIRSFVLGVTPWGGDASYVGGANLASVHVSSGIHWSTLYPVDADRAIGTNCNTGDEDAIRACFTRRFENLYSWYRSNLSWVYTYGNTSHNVIYGAQMLFVHALQATADYKNNGANSLVAGPTVSLTLQNVEEISTTERENKSYQYATFHFENYDANTGYINNIQVTCADCARYGITISDLQAKGSSGSWQPINYNTDITKLVAANPDTNLRTGDVKIRFTITKPVKDDADCSATADYKVTYKYYDDKYFEEETSDYSAAWLEANSTNKQRFVIIWKNTNDGNNGNDGAGKGAFDGEQSGTIPVCTSAPCETKIKTPICSFDETEATATVTAPTKIKTCVIGNTDEAKNTYKLSVNNTNNKNNYTLSDTNKYCGVFCKEDYSEIKLQPTVKNVVCGTYFKLTSSIKGKKDCYTGSTKTTNASMNGKASIDKDQYLKDIKEAQEQMVDAMNRYYEFTAKSNHTSSTTSVAFSCDKTCGTKTTITVKWEKYTEVTFTWNNENGTYKNGTHDGGSKSFEDQCGCETCGTAPNTHSCCGGCDNSAQTGYDNWKKEVAEGLEKAKNDLATWKKQYENLIKEFNACTTGWSNEFVFDQQIKYYYNETHQDGVYTTYNDLLSVATLENADYLMEDTTNKVNDKITINVCLGRADENYNCLGSKVTFNTNIDVSGTQNDGYNATYGSSIFPTRTYIVCTTDGCKTEQRRISQASFIQKTVEKEKSYITPTAFYQIEHNGRTTVNGNYAGTRMRIDPIKNALPVSDALIGGGVFKLMIQNLGEYYNTGKTGRLIDFEGKTETTSVAYAQKLTNNSAFNGEYTCHYYADCPNPDCPDCIFTCEGDSCGWCSGPSCHTDCPDCTFTCINCLFGMGDLQVITKTISTTTIRSSVTSATRKYGYNWLTSSSISKLQLLHSKASKTLEEIEEYNETIYNDSVEKTGTSAGLAFSIKMTPDVINTIKTYNTNHESEGGYGNDSLTCYDATIGGQTYASIYCYSEFIDELIDSGATITGIENRPSANARGDIRDNTNAANNGYSTRNENASFNGYFELWSGYSYSESMIGGPSWK